MALAESWRGLRTAAVVAAAGSTVRGAELLHLSQSSVVRAVQALEATLGWMVFERSAQGMQPTAQGRAVLLRTGRAAQQLHAFTSTGLSAPAMPWWANRVVMGLGLRHMRLLLALCATRSVAQAADHMQVSLPAVHQTLAQLEHLAGSALFLRTRKGIRPTEAGDQLLRAVQLCLAELRQGDEELAFLQGRPQGQLTIGTLPFSTGMLLAPAVDEVLRGQGAGLRITIVDGTYDALVHQLRHADIDLLVGALRPAAPVMTCSKRPCSRTPWPWSRGRAIRCWRPVWHGRTWLRRSGSCPCRTPPRSARLKRLLPPPASRCRQTLCAPTAPC